MIEDNLFTVGSIRISIYLKTVFELVLGYLLLAPLLLLIFTSFYEGFPAGFKLVIVIIGCVLHGLIFHYIALFTHAAGHRELARSRKLNDAIGNLLAGYLFLTSIPAYRRKHFGHHRYIGTDKDPEGTYALSPSFKNFFYVFFYIVPLKKAFQNFYYSAGNSDQTSSSFEILQVIVVFLCIQLLVLCVFLSADRLWEWIFLWAIPLYNLTPLFTWLRTLSEHRPLVPQHGYDAIYRAFNRDWLAFFLGAAGFRDHDLHHYYPSVHHQLFQSLNLPLEVSGKRSRSSYFSVILSICCSR